MQQEDLRISAKRGNRPVWVVNDFDYDRHPEMEGVAYVEEFRGQTISIEPRGRIQMPSLAAERFMGQPVAPAEVLRLPNGQFTGIPKALKIVEFTESELKQVGLSQKKFAEADKAAADKSKLTCAICGVTAASEKGLKIHVTKQHPDLEPAPEE